MTRFTAIPFTEEMQRQFLDLHANGLLPHQIAREMGFHKSTVLKWHEILKVPTNTIFDKKRRQWVNLHEQGYTVEAIARKTRSCPKNIKKHLLSCGLKPHGGRENRAANVARDRARKLYPKFREMHDRGLCRQQIYQQAHATRWCVELFYEETGLVPHPDPAKPMITDGIPKPLTEAAIPWSFGGDDVVTVEMRRPPRQGKRLVDLDRF